MKKIISLIGILFVLNTEAQITISGTTVTLVCPSTQPILYCPGDITINPFGKLTSNGTLELLGNLTNSGTYTSIGTEKFTGSGNQTISGIFSDSSFLGSIIKQNTGNIILTNNTDCYSVVFTSNGTMDASTGITLSIKDPSYTALANYSEYRYVDIGLDGHLKRFVNDTITNHYYDFPIGNYVYGYKKIGINLLSLGISGNGYVAGTLIPTLGNVSYHAHYPVSSCSNNGQWVDFNNLDPCAWNFYGPDDYVYHVLGNSATASLPPQRVIQSAYGLNTWNEFIPNVTCDTTLAMCTHSDWTGTASEIPGGPYRGFNDLTIARNTGTPLPVELTTFTASTETECIQLNWITSLEINNEKFIILRSTDGITFTSIGEMPGHGTSTQSQSYLFTDCNVDAEVIYYYQLEQIDYDGATNASPIVSASTTYTQETVLNIRNILGQEISQLQPGINLITVKTKNGLVTKKLCNLTKL